MTTTTTECALVLQFANGGWVTSQPVSGEYARRADYRDSPMRASGSIWRLRDREFRIIRNPPFAHWCRQRGTGTSNDQRSAPRSRPCARSLALDLASQPALHHGIRLRPTPDRCVVHG